MLRCCRHFALARDSHEAHSTVEAWGWEGLGLERDIKYRNKKTITDASQRASMQASAQAHKHMGRKTRWQARNH
eukprot:12751670-Alexandrium_andersonii.AAC.1